MSNKHERTCKNCGSKFESVRHDAFFCEPRCAAAYARNNGDYRERIHAEKPRWNRATCEHCQSEFEYNDYAQRGGKRKAQYCSNKCRQAAYRARKGWEAGYSGNWDDARNDKRTREEKAKDTSRKQSEQKKDTSHEQPKKDTSQSQWWASKDPYQVIGVTYLNTAKEAKSAYMKLVKKYHPDVSKDPNATVIMQAVNAAWDKIKNKNWRM